MKTLPLIAFLMLAVAAFSPGVRAEDVAKDQPAKTKCCGCSTVKDGKMTCSMGGECCCSGTQTAPAEKVIPKSSYNRKS